MGCVEEVLGELRLLFFEFLANVGEESLDELRFFRFELLVSVTGLLSTGVVDVAVAGEDKEEVRLLTWTDGVAGEPPDLFLVDRRDGVCCPLGELDLADLLFLTLMIFSRG